MSSIGRTFETGQTHTQIAVQYAYLLSAHASGIRFLTGSSQALTVVCRWQNSHMGTIMDMSIGMEKGRITVTVMIMIMDMWMRPGMIMNMRTGMWSKGC